MTANLPDPQSNPDLFDNILPRRVIAYLIDFGALIVVNLLLKAVLGVAGIFTFGLAWLGFFITWPLAVLLYYSLTLGSSGRATLGMRAMDLVMTPAGDFRLDGWRAVAHPVLFWLSIWISWPVSLAIVLFTPRRQMLHDLVLKVLLVRRSPMVDHWRSLNRRYA